MKLIFHSRWVQFALTIERDDPVPNGEMVSNLDGDFQPHPGLPEATEWEDDYPEFGFRSTGG